MGGIRLPTLRSLRRLHFQEQKRVPRCCTSRAAPAALQFGRRTLKLRSAFVPAHRYLPHYATGRKKSPPPHTAADQLVCPMCGTASFEQACQVPTPLLKDWRRAIVWQKTTRHSRHFTERNERKPVLIRSLSGHSFSIPLDGRASPTCLCGARPRRTIPKTARISTVAPRARRTIPSENRISD